LYTRSQLQIVRCTSFQHIFTAPSMEEGVNALFRWTLRKGIDAYSKKCIFIPIHLDHHRSLFSVLNPLLVPLPAVAGEYHYPDQLDVPALVTMDSLKFYIGYVIATLFGHG